MQYKILISLFSSNDYKTQIQLVKKYKLMSICVNKFCNIRSNCEIEAQYFGDMMTQMWMFLRATARWQVDRSEVAWAVTIEGNISNFLTSSQVGCFAAPEWVLTFNLPKKLF